MNIIGVRENKTKQPRILEITNLSFTPFNDCSQQCPVLRRPMYPDLGDHPGAGELSTTKLIPQNRNCMFNFVNLTTVLSKGNCL